MVKTVKIKQILGDENNLLSMNENDVYNALIGVLESCDTENWIEIDITDIIDDNV